MALATGGSRQQPGLGPGTMIGYGTPSQSNEPCPFCEAPMIQVPGDQVLRVAYQVTPIRNGRAEVVASRMAGCTVFFCGSCRLSFTSPKA